MTMHNWITCRSGVRLVVDAPTVDMIHLEDIAYGTARKCRFAGQGREYCSVAQHQSYGARRLMDHGYPVLARAFLIHDASEAYFNDLPTPLKVKCPDYEVLEENLQRVIFQRFDVPWAAMESIHGLDKQLACEEGLLNYPGFELPWLIPGSKLDVLAGFKPSTFLRRIYDGVRVRLGLQPTSFLDERSARIDYLNTFKEVFGYAS